MTAPEGAGRLYLVATPIGNLGDITHRAVETLKGADVIACEDTRHSRVLFDRYGIRVPTVSYHDFSEKRRAPELLERLVAGQKVALISDAGTPGIADPGYRLVRAAIDAGIPVEPLPGPAAFLAALAVSGLPTDRFTFEGFFPVKAGAKKKKLLELRAEGRTAIFYESPHRLVKTLSLMRETLGDVPVVVARELTKKFEEVFRGTLSQAVERFGRGKVLGEIVVLFHPEAGEKGRDGRSRTDPKESV
ncbi:MAG TPA: 16S rRNA (cytidine(1402)-2'-O)-methyltransferase [Candidatus Eisenbacteria bacterium]|nr:16S rRNA (cytidine(1402)-2'-O)-methyltransferase [Candidatus Eisenbacteria bacterium]